MTRIPPLEPPYHPNFAYAMERTMPPGMAPLVLFRTLATSFRAWDKFAAGSLLDPGPLSLREREIVIARTCARCGCSYEWGLHVKLFQESAGLSDAQVRDTAAGTPGAKLWSDAERALIAAVDALIDRKKLSDDEFAELSAQFQNDQILELVQLVGFYHGVSLICGALDLPAEPGMPTLPGTDA